MVPIPLLAVLRSVYAGRTHVLQSEFHDAMLLARLLDLLPLGAQRRW